MSQDGHEPCTLDVARRVRDEADRAVDVEPPPRELHQHRARPLEDVPARVLPVGDERRIHLPAAAQVEPPGGNRIPHVRKRLLVEVASLGGAGKLVPVGVRVWRREQDSCPCLEGDPAQLDALLDRRCPVVARWDDMAVDVDESLH